MRVPFSSKSTSLSPDRVWLGLVSHGVVEDATMLRPISDGGRGVGGGNGPSLKRRLGPHSCPLRSHERHFSRTDQSRSAGRHYWLGKVRPSCSQKCWSLTLIFLRRQSSHFLCAFSPRLFVPAKPEGSILYNQHPQHEHGSFWCLESEGCLWRPDYVCMAG